MNIRDRPDIAAGVRKALAALNNARGPERAEILWLMVELGHAQGAIDSCERMLNAKLPEAKAPEAKP